MPMRGRFDSMAPGRFARCRRAGSSAALGMLIGRAVRRQVAERAAYYQAAFENAPLGIVELDQDGRIVRANAKALELLAHDKPAGLGLEDIAWPQGGRWAGDGAGAEVAGGRPGDAFDLSIARPNGGGPVWLRAIVGGRLASGGRFVWLHDATASRRAEAERERRLRLKELSATAGHGRAGAEGLLAAHALRLPINAIIGHCDSLAGDSGQDDEARARRVQGIHAAALRLLRAVNELADDAMARQPGAIDRAHIRAAALVPA